MSRVSVIIPTYNRANYIAEAIQSVLNQTYSDFEIIVVDDGSTDNTKEIVGNFKDPRIKYLYQENQGICGARNTGINASIGEYIVFLDSDDALLEKTIEKGVQVLDNHPEVGLSYGQRYIVDEKGHTIQLVKPRHKSPGVYHGTEEILNILRYGNYVASSQAMVRRSSINEVGFFDPAFSSGSNDFELWMRIIRKYAVLYIAEPVVKFRVHSGSLSSGRDLAEIKETHSRILEGIFNDTALGSFFSSHRNKAYYHLYLRLASYACMAGNNTVSRKYLFQALKIYPRAIIKSIFINWLYLAAKTYIPVSVLRTIRGIKRSF